MGMAASQARFLGLTARKTNVEYEGQQINQQRTTLSNTTANYYNDLLGMSVPVPPSVEDYTKTVYTFKDGALTNSINTMIAKGQGLYEISYTSNWTNDFAVTSSAPVLYTRTNKTPILSNNEAKIVYELYKTYVDVYTDYEELTEEEKEADHPGAKVIAFNRYGSNDKDDPFFVANQKNPRINLSTAESLTDAEAQLAIYKSDYDDYLENLSKKSDEFENKYLVGAKRLRMLGQINTDGDGKYAGTELADGTMYFDEYLSTLSAVQLSNLKKEEENYINMLTDKYGESEKGWLVRYIENTTTGEWNPYFVNADILESNNMVYDDNTGSSQTAINTYKLGSVEENEEFRGVKARMESDTTGRIISVTLHPGETDEVTYAVSTETVTDQAKYDDAMNQYEYDKAQYDQTIQEINAKIEIIQAEDKNLELRLKQLDTEQDAIQTEMDAVQKIIEKNVESTFKTFG